VGVVVGLGVFVAVGVEEGVPGLVFGGVGVGVASARVDGALPLTRTNPVPTVMISGLRTDRASTAHDLLNDRL
jgi:hypothetical protein